MTNKTYLWNREFEESHGDSLFIWRDIITKDRRAIPEQHWKAVVKKTAYDNGWKSNASTLESITQKVYELLAPEKLPTIPEAESEFNYETFCLLPSFNLSGATIADRALMCSAVAYCLTYGRDDTVEPDAMNRLRLSAMTLELYEIVNLPDGIEYHPKLKDIYERVRQEAEALHTAIWNCAEDVLPIRPEPIAGSEVTLENLLYCASLVCSNRLKIENGQWQQPDPTDTNDIDNAIDTIKSKADFSSHPLVRVAESIGSPRIALVLGGATKIKSYFLESARLPEIRGASTLLDRINLEDVPALFGGGQSEKQQRANEVRRHFKNRTGLSVNAPECVIYANGGNVLAFAPVSIASELAQEIENIYTSETLVANSVAVCESFDLIELHYGLRPEAYWVGECIEGCKNDLRPLIDPAYRLKKDRSVRPFDEEESRGEFYKKKCFGELGAALAIKQHHRRNGNTLDSRNNGIEVKPRPSRAYPPQYETLPQARRCSSCERRPAIVREPKDSEKYLCAACARKRLAGRLSESSRSKEQYPNALRRLRDFIDWPPQRSQDWMDEITDWVDRFIRFIDKENKLSERYWNYRKGSVLPAQDLAEIADDNNFVGLIYADGNNVGSIIEQIQTAIEYRQFAQRLFEANQAAVFRALASVLRPHKRTPNEERPDKVKKLFADGEGKITVHPFEILSIGGDDFMLFVPGDRALEIALQIGSNLEEAFRSKWVYRESVERKGKQLKCSQRYCPDEYEEEADCAQPAVSLSAGVVIADCHTPVYFMEQLAEQLLKSAKQYAKTLKKCGYRGGTIDFMALKSVTGITSDVGSFRKSVLEREENGGERIKLYARPYTLHELRGLLKTSREFKNPQKQFPRSQLYSLRNDALDPHQGRMTSMLNYLYFRARAKNEVAQVMREHFEMPWWGKAAEWLHPWREVKDAVPKTFETLIYDLVEIYDFAAGDDNGNQAE
ncbi:MAG: hypothetical protein L0229_08995 [Blastocatellia bacterium]|nr:hypothetical protein [Blastocatellia bacterium]